MSSKPTVWDGDIVFPVPTSHAKYLCSKPTVWDGDFLAASLAAIDTTCSKPTVWDRDS